MLPKGFLLRLSPISLQRLDIQSFLFLHKLLFPYAKSMHIPFPASMHIPKFSSLRFQIPSIMKKLNLSVLNMRVRRVVRFLPVCVYYSVSRVSTHIICLPTSKLIYRQNLSVTVYNHFCYRYFVFRFLRQCSHMSHIPMKHSHNGI